MGTLGPEVVKAKELPAMVLIIKAITCLTKKTDDAVEAPIRYPPPTLRVLWESCCYGNMGGDRSSQHYGFNTGGKVSLETLTSTCL